MVSYLLSLLAPWFKSCRDLMDEDSKPVGPLNPSAV